jgi:hypothetical protein
MISVRVSKPASRRAAHIVATAVAGIPTPARRELDRRLRPQLVATAAVSRPPEGANGDHPADTPTGRPTTHDRPTGRRTTDDRRPTTCSLGGTSNYQSLFAFPGISAGWSRAARAKKGLREWLAGGIMVERQRALSGGGAVAVVTGLVALWAVTAGWWLRYLDTALHEGGHALLVWAHGGKVHRVHIERGGGGFTAYLPGSSSASADFLVSAAGYTGPSLAGLLAAKLLSNGNVTAVFILAVLALAALLLVVENSFGIFVVLACAAGLIGLERYAPTWLGDVCAYFLTWFLLMSGVKSVVILRRARRYGSRTSDADALAQVTHIPAFLWVFAFGLVSLFCLVKGAVLLVG